MCEAGGWSENLRGLTTTKHNCVLVVGLRPVKILTEQLMEGCWISVHVCFDTSCKTKGHETSLTHGRLKTRAGNTCYSKNEKKGEM